MLDLTSRKTIRFEADSANNNANETSRSMIKRRKRKAEEPTIVFDLDSHEKRGERKVQNWLNKLGFQISKVYILLILTVPP